MACLRTQLNGGIFCSRQHCVQISACKPQTISLYFEEMLIFHAFPKPFWCRKSLGHIYSQSKQRGFQKMSWEPHLKHPLILHYP